MIMPVTATVIMMYRDFSVASALGLNFLLASAYCTRAHTEFGYVVTTDQPRANPAAQQDYLLSGRGQLQQACGFTAV